MMSRLSKTLFFPRSQNPNHYLLHYYRPLPFSTPEQDPSSLLSALPRTFSTSSAWDLKESSSELESDGQEQSKPNKTAKKPLHLFLRESVGLVPKNAEGGGEDKGNELCQKLRELQRRLGELRVSRKVSAPEDQIGKMKEEGLTPASRLYGAFSGNVPGDKGRAEEAVSSDGSKAGSPLKSYVIKEVSRDMEMFLDHLHKKEWGGMGRSTRDTSRIFIAGSISRTLPRSSGRIIRTLQNRIGVGGIPILNALLFMRIDPSLEIPNLMVYTTSGKSIGQPIRFWWLSGSDLKTLAMFGCPSVATGTVLDAKSLRCFFEIPENTVCSKCLLKDSCKFVNRGLHDGGSKHLSLPAAMRVIVLYALVPEEIKGCVSRLLRDIVKLSETTT